MSLAIDAIILFGAVLIIWRGAGRGLVRSVMGLITTAVSFIAAYAYTPILSEYIRDKYLTDKITEGIFETVKSLALDTSTDMYNLDRLAADKPDPFISILDRYNIKLSDIVEKIFGVTGCTEKAVHTFASEIARPTAQIIANCISFIGLFFAVFIVLSIFTGILNLIFKLPVLSQANSLLGMLFGVVEALLFSFVMAVVLSYLVSSLGALDATLFGKSVVEDTRICKFLVEYNPIKYITYLILN